MKKIAILLMVISSSVYAQTAQLNPVPSDWKTYSKDNYSIQYPPNWGLGENVEGTIFDIIAPVDSLNPNFKRNINLVVQDLKGQGIDLEKYNDISVKQIKESLPNDTIIVDEKGNDRMGEYRHLIFVGDENTFHLQFEQYYRIINETAYVLTLTMHTRQWRNGHRLGEQILSTFSFKQ